MRNIKPLAQFAIGEVLRGNRVCVIRMPNYRRYIPRYWVERGGRAYVIVVWGWHCVDCHRNTLDNPVCKP